MDVFVGRSHNALCPVSAMLAFSGVREGMVEALFRFQDGGVLTRDCFVGHIREVLSKAGLDARNYEGHSFRSGAATTVARWGIPDATIKLLGRWRSCAYLLFVQTPRNELAAVSETVVHIVLHYLPLCYRLLPMMFTLMIVHTSQGGTKGICEWWDWRKGRDGVSLWAVWGLYIARKIRGPPSHSTPTSGRDRHTYVHDILTRRAQGHRPSALILLYQQRRHKQLDAETMVMIEDCKDNFYITESVKSLVMKYLW